ncbi:LytR/AlgR family response regulator transcription factor [Paludibacterium yongneupense]|uniref:LytR/AlgR family response regulator transcription factor n=1 Tax=Paludibacterium yongneupense TaxID=400061 RepID=UPI000423ADC1|nr:LytTR family DNA-binding domain-containing protein [Paludibacterium yongneupense]
MKALIVEDEYLAREELVWLVESHSRIEVLASVEDGLAAFQFLQQHDVDVVFLDIRIPSIDGMMLAHNLSRQARPPRIVFVTAYKEYAAQAFDLEAFDYILKPFNEQRVINTLQRLEKTDPGAQSSPPPPAGGATAVRTVNLVKGESIIVMPCDQIYYAEADEKLTYVHTLNERFVMTMTLSEFAGRLPEPPFFRCHRSWCVNLGKIREIAPWFNGTYVIKLHELKVEIPVSRSHVKAFKQLMQL